MQFKMSHPVKKNTTFETHKKSCIMTKEEYLELALSKWPELEKLDQVKDFYEYEKRFAEIMLELNRAVLEGKISNLPNDRRKKTKSGVDLEL